jgi:hypothetical protein
MKIIFINLSPFALQINVKILKHNGAYLVEKKDVKKNKDCPFSRFECFKHAKTFFIYVKL